MEDGRKFQFNGKVGLMSPNDSKLPPGSEDWGVVLQSVPSKKKKDVIKQLETIFHLDREDAEQVLANVPLLLVDHVPFTVATRIKKFFQKLGAVAETTNHDMIKKNCFQIVWPEMPDLTPFMEEPAAVAAKTAPASVLEKQTPVPEPVPEAPRAAEAPAVASSPVTEPAPITPPVEVPPQTPAVSSQVDLEWERRARELNEKLQKIQQEKEQMCEEHAEVSEKTKNEFQEKLDQERQKKEEIAKAYELLQQEAQKQEALTREGEEWRSKAMALGEKVREIETDLMRKNSAIEHLVHEKDELSGRARRAEELDRRVAELEASGQAKDQEKWLMGERIGELEKNAGEIHRQLEEVRRHEQELSLQTSEAGRRIQELDQSIAAKENEKNGLLTRIAELEKYAAEAGREIESARHREQELKEKSSGLERSLESMEESLRSRDAALAQFEKQVLELAEKVSESEHLRQEYAKLVQERATIRKEYDAKLAEQEVRFARVEDEHRRYRSRADRKNAAATRELGEWVRGVDTVRQGLQKLILFLGSESAVLDTEKKFQLRSPLTRGPDAPSAEKQ